jgi:HTH-type transcriptional regulator/antitoxin HigA
MLCICVLYMMHMRLAPPQHPGKILRKKLEEVGWTQDELAAITGKNRQSFAKIIGGATGISAEMAVTLAAAFGNEAEEWLRWGAQYELSLVEAPVASIEKRARIYSGLPIREMQKRGWIRATADPELLEADLELLMGQSIEDSGSFPLAARKTDPMAELSGEEKAWAFRARQLAATLPVSAFDPNRLEVLTKKLRVLAAYPEEVQKLSRLLADFGVKFVIVEPLPGARLDGAVFWIDGSPVIAMSARFDRNDNFWFTLFHEVGHIRAGDAYSFDSLAANDTDRFSIGDVVAEANANQFAAEVLVPRGELTSFIRRVSPLYPETRIVQFSNRVKMHPGIILGQLQKEGELSFGAHRSLIVKIRELVIKTALTDGWGYSISPKLTGN